MWKKRDRERKREREKGVLGRLLPIYLRYLRKGPSGGLSNKNPVCTQSLIRIMRNDGGRACVPVRVCTVRSCFFNVVAKLVKNDSLVRTAERVRTRFPDVPFGASLKVCAATYCRCQLTSGLCCINYLGKLVALVANGLRSNVRKVLIPCI